VIANITGKPKNPRNRDYYDPHNWAVVDPYGWFGSGTDPLYSVGLYGIASLKLWQ
jgi:hypothetical protein